MYGCDQSIVLKVAFLPAQKRGERIVMGGSFEEIPARSFALKCTRSPMPSHSPSYMRSCRLGRTCPPKRENLMLDEPAFRSSE